MWAISPELQIAQTADRLKYIITVSTTTYLLHMHAGHTICLDVCLAQKENCFSKNVEKQF